VVEADGLGKVGDGDPYMGQARRVGHCRLRT
jgi:hypothetical protein